jgi:hypothetical protein
MTTNCDPKQSYFKQLFVAACAEVRTTRFALVLLLVLSGPLGSWAQTLSGTLRVEVTDPSGALVPDAKVTITNDATQVSSSLSKGDSGLYTFPSLNVGTYTVVVEKQGFNRYVKKKVVIAASVVAEAKVPLLLGTSSTTVEVSALGADLVQTTTSTLSSGFEGSVAERIPLNQPGGDVKELAVFLPNTTTQPGGATGGSGGSVGGLRPRYNSFTIDGVDDNNIVTNGPLTPVIEDAVADFQVITNQFSAEYGHSAGGLFEITTKSGTNAFHGEAHEYNRNRNYDAWTNLEKQNTDPEHPNGQQNRFDYNRFGASIGGPIKKDRLFFFAAYERQNNGLSAAATPVIAPTAAGLSTLNGLAHDQAVKDILTQFPAAGTADQSPLVINGTSVPMGTFVAVAPSFFNQHDIIGNVDLNLARHALRGRFLFDRFRSPNVNTVMPQSQFTGTYGTDARKGIFSDAWTVSDHVVNDFRASYSRAVGPQLTVPGKFSNFPNVEVDPLGLNVGPNGCSPQGGVQNTYQWSDTVSYARGKHGFKGGAEVRKTISPSIFLPRSRGEWDYAGLQTFINDQVPDGANGALRGAGSPTFAANYNSFYGFLQDDWKVSHRLTLNLGIRYEYNGVPRDESTQAFNAVASFPGPLPGFPNGIIFGIPKPDTNNWGPRVGFAYDPFANGKWAIRGGFGIAYDVTPTNFPDLDLPPQLQSEQEPAVTCALAGAPPWCTNISAGFLQSGGLLQVNVPPTDQASARAATQGFYPDIVEPKILTWSLGVQHEITKDTSLEVRYVGTRGISLPAQIRWNSRSAFDPTVPGGGIPAMPTYFSQSSVPSTVASPASTLQDFDNFNPAPLSVVGFQSVMTVIPPVAFSNYHGGSVTVTHRFSHGLYLMGSFTHGHTIDDATNELFSSRVNPRRAEDGFNLSQDRGNSVLDLPNKFVLTGVYELPNANFQNAFARAVLHGWQISGSYLAQNGQPITALSGTDANDNGDAAGDRAILNPAGVGRTGTAFDYVCNDGAGGATRIIVQGTTDPSNPNAGIPCGPLVSGSYTDANIVGYVAENPNARFVQAGVGTRTNIGRNTIPTPGLNLWNMSVLKNVRFNERLSMQFRAEAFDTFNHYNFSIGLPTNNGTVDSTTNPNPLSTSYPFVISPNFLDSHIFSGGSRTMEFGMKVIF